MAITYVALASGKGSNFEAIAQAIEKKTLPKSEIIHLFSNNPAAPVLEKAKKFQIPATVIQTSNLLEKIEKLNPDYLLLLGYMRILKGEILKVFKDRILNIHPSLLPQFKGLNAIQQAFEAKAPVTGCTVHLVTEGIDEGPVIHQKQVPILSTDTLESLTQRVHLAEHDCLIEVLKKLESGFYPKR